MTRSLTLSSVSEKFIRETGPLSSDPVLLSLVNGTEETQCLRDSVSLSSVSEKFIRHILLSSG